MDYHYYDDGDYYYFPPTSFRDVSLLIRSLRVHIEALRTDSSRLHLTRGHECLAAVNRRFTAQI